MQPESILYDCLDVLMRLENVYYDDTTKIRFIRIYNKEGSYHSYVGPSVISFDLDGSIDEERYYINGVNIKNIKYDKGIPVTISTHENDVSRYEYYNSEGMLNAVDFYKKGLLEDNDLEPARTIYDYENNVKVCEYYSCGRLTNSLILDIK
jgi:hypothetical protein